MMIELEEGNTTTFDSDDAPAPTITTKYPIAVYYILGNELCERHYYLFDDCSFNLL